VLRRNRGADKVLGATIPISRTIQVGARWINNGCFPGRGGASQKPDARPFVYPGVGGNRFPTCFCKLLKDSSDAAQSRPKWSAWAGLCAVGIFLVLAARFWDPVFGFTKFLQFDEDCDRTKIAAFQDIPVYLFKGNEGYDGMFYAQIACSPWLGAPDLVRAVDNLPWRARRILLPAAAWVIGFGRPPSIVRTYASLNLLFWLILAATLWRLLKVRDLRGWCAWAGVLFSAGALGSVRFALSDMPAVALLAAGMLAAESGRPGWAAGGLAAAGLTRETALLALPGFWQTGRSNIPRLMLALVPFAAWMLYIRWRIGSTAQVMDSFAWPGSGLVEKIRDGVAAAIHPWSVLDVWISLLSTIGICVQALYLAIKPELRNPWWRVGAGYLLLMFFISHAVWEGYPGAALRVLLPLALAFNILAARRKAAMVWLLAGNLSVFSGAVAMARTSGNTMELSSGGGEGVAYAVRARNGWYGCEQNGRHRWDWSPGKAILTVETWPRVSAASRINLRLRALGPRNVTIRQDGRDLWSGEVTAKQLSVSIQATLSMGRAELEFSSPGAPQRPPSSSDPRELAFAVYDPTVSILRSPAFSQ